MRIADMNWQQVAAYLRKDDRCVVPLGCTEQHGLLSLYTDAILAERIAIEAAEPLGVPVFPVLPFTPTPSFAAFPGTISLRLQTLLDVVRDILYSLHRTGFRRVLLVNGHGGNTPVRVLSQDVMIELPVMSIKLHNWWSAPNTVAAADAIDRNGSHANWYENFPWTRLPGVAEPATAKPMVDSTLIDASAPAEVMKLLGDGSYGGDYRKDDESMLALWQTGVQETRVALQGPWGPIRVQP